MEEEERKAGWTKLGSTWFNLCGCVFGYSG